MKRLFSHGDGRLKTGRLSWVVFLALLVCGALFFKAGQQLDTVIVEVKHQFEPQPDVQQPQDQGVETAVVQPASSATVSESSAAEASPEIPSAMAAIDQPRSDEDQTVNVQQDVVQPLHNDVGVATEQISTQAIATVAEEVQQPSEQLTSIHSSQPLSLDSEAYFTLMKAWAASGKNTSSAQTESSIPLEVENLHQCYALFQMKVIAVNVKGQLFDLVDGSRLPQQALDDYSSTVISVEHPWQHWQGELKRAKFKHHDTVQVRYYMYPFVRNAIYARCQQGFEWCKQRGFIDADTQPEQVDIVGKTFEIQRNGGGKFGVFVPQTLTTAAGEQITISPAAFDGQADIVALQQFGVL